VSVQINILLGINESAAEILKTDLPIFLTTVENATFFKKSRKLCNKEKVALKKKIFSLLT
jgi:hypothetical protein